MKNLFHNLASSLAHTGDAQNENQDNSSHSSTTTFYTSAGDLFQIFESTDANITFGVIKIQLKVPYFYLTDAAHVLHDFVNLLKNSFAIVHSTEPCYNIASQLKHHVTTVYWQDVACHDWKVLGWTDGHGITVRYIKNISNLPVEWEAYFFKELEAA